MAINNLNNLLNTTNKVGSKPAQVSGADVSTSGSKSTAETTSSAKGAVAQDAVVLTDQAQLLAKLQQKVGTSTTTNQSKVESLKLAIEKGEYSVDSNRVAKKMLDMESALDKLNE